MVSRAIVRVVLFVPSNPTQLITPVAGSLFNSSLGTSLEEREAESYINTRWFTETGAPIPMVYSDTLSANAVAGAFPYMYSLSQGYHHGLPTQTQTSQVDAYAFVSAESIGVLPAQDGVPTTSYNSLNHGEVSPEFENPGNLLRYPIHPGGPASLTMNLSMESFQVSCPSAKVCGCLVCEGPWY